MTISTERIFVVGKVIASWACEANFIQFVDISSILVSLPWRSSTVNSIHYYAEKFLFELSDHGPLAALQSGRFMTNTLIFDRPKDDFIFVIADTDKPQGQISPNDIGVIAAVILGEDIKKYDNLVYGLNRNVMNPT
ncbi:hypothetical protein G6F43_007908 [Rhizopus delemar]|nr:hypothetical protein G6F43_007908 [Rhizopus delemar]